MRDSLGLAQGGIRLSQQEVPLRINSGSNTGAGLLLPRRQLAADDRRAARDALPDRAVLRRQGRRRRRSPTPRRATSRRDFTRDPAWYTDIRDAGQRVRRADRRRHGHQPEGQRSPKAEEYGTAGRQVHGDLLPRGRRRRRRPAASRRRRRARRRAAPDARRVIALLEASIDAPTSTDTPGTVGGTVPATLSLTLGAPATFGAVHAGRRQGLHGDHRRPPSPAPRVTRRSSRLATPGHLVNGAFSLPQPLQAGSGRRSRRWAARQRRRPSRPGRPRPRNEAVTITFKQSIAANDALRTGTYSKTLTFTLSTTTP